MATKITEMFIENQGVSVDESTKKALSYYEKAKDIIKRTHAAMGRDVKFETKITSTINGKINCNTSGNTH